MKKIIKTLLVVMVVVLALTAFVACDFAKEEETTQPVGCQHQGGKATCTEAPVCELCGEIYGEALGHKGGTATCGKLAVCATCGEEYGELVAEHTVEYHADEYYCEKEGLSSGSSCSVCGKVIRQRFPLAPTGHKMSEGTCTEDSVCLNPGCDHKVEAPGHSYEAVVTAPTCTEAGYTTYTCVCGDTYTGDEVASLGGHTPGAEATCTTAQICTVCEEELVAKLGHAGHEADFLCDVCEAVVEPEADSTLTLEQANALGLLVTTTQNKYYITGTVQNVANTFNGNIYITNGTTTFYIYGTKSADGSIAYSKFETPIYAGDTVVMYGYISLYDGAAQMKDAWMTSCTHEHVYSEATCEKVATCACGLTQGELGDHNYKDGMCTVCNKLDPDYEGEVTVTVGKADFNTIDASTDYKKTYTTTNGWTTTNCCVLKGGLTDANPAFIFIGDASTRAITLNGNKNTVGKLSSPVLSGGISKLSFKYGHAYSDRNGVDITINVIQNGVVVASYRHDNDTVTQKTAYEFTWTLEEEVKGDFSIEIINNSPSAATSGNKDRVSIWDLEWVSN